MNLKNGKVLTSKSVGTGPWSYEIRIYRAAVWQRLRNTDVGDVHTTVLSGCELGEHLRREERYIPMVLVEMIITGVLWNRMMCRKYVHQAFFTLVFYALLYFNGPYQFTQLLNLRPLLFGLTPFGWLPSITETPYFWYVRDFDLRRLQERNKDVKQGLGVLRHVIISTLCCVCVRACVFLCHSQVMLLTFVLRGHFSTFHRLSEDGRLLW